jgi:hypothetical protein
VISVERAPDHWKRCVGKFSREAYGDGAGMSYPGDAAVAEQLRFGQPEFSANFLLYGSDGDGQTRLGFSA